MNLPETFSIGSRNNSSTIDSQSLPETVSIGSAPPGFMLQPEKWSEQSGLQYQAPTYSDYGNLAAEGFSHTIAGLSDWMGDTNAAEDWRQRGQRFGASVSPDARANFNASMGSQRWREHPFSSFALNLAQQSPSLLAIAAGEALGGPAGAGLAGFLTQGAGGADALVESVNNTPDEQLGPRFQQLVASGMTSHDARQVVTQEALDKTHAATFAGILGAGVGAAGPIAQFARGPISGAAEKGVTSWGQALAGMGRSGVETGLVVGAQDLGTNLALNQAYGEIGIPQTSTEDMLAEAGKQAAIWGAAGALGGFRIPRRPGVPEPPEPGPLQLTYDTKALPPPYLRLPPPTRLLPKPEWSPQGILEETRVPADMYAQQTGQYSYRASEGMPMGPPEAAPTPPPREGEGFWANMPLRERTQGDFSQEPAQTPTAPLKSAQAAPLMPSKDLSMDADKRQQAQDRHENPVAGEFSSIRSGRIGRTKTRAGTDIDTTEEKAQDTGPPIASHPVNDEQKQALMAALNVKQMPTIDSRLAERLRNTPPETIQNTIDNLRQQGGDRNARIADMIEQHRPEQEENIQNRPVDRVSEIPNIGARPPEPPTGGIEPPQATPLAPPPPEARSTPAPAPATAIPREAAPPAHGYPDELAPLIPETRRRIEEILQRSQALRAGEEGAAQPQKGTVESELPIVRRKKAEFEEQKPGALPKWKREALARENQTAKDIVAAHPPTSRDANAMLSREQGYKEGMLVPLRARLKAMVDAAESKGVKLPEKFYKVPEGGVEPYHKLILAEAKRFLKYTERDLSERARQKAVEDFLMRENELREGRAGSYNRIVDERVSEEEEALKKQHIGPRAGVETKTPEDIEKIEQERIGGQRELTPEQHLLFKERLGQAQKILQDRVNAWAKAQKKGIKSLADIKRNEELKAAAEKALEDASDLGLYVPKTFKISDLRDWAEHGDKGQPIGEGPAGTSTDGSIAVEDTRDSKPSDKPEYTKATPLRQTTIQDVLKNIDYSSYHPAFRGMMKILVNKLSQLVGDTPIYVFDDKEWHNFMDRGDQGAYDPVLKHMVMHKDFMDNSPILVHEAFHAATLLAYQTDKAFRGLVDRLYKEIDAQSRYIKGGASLRYAFTKPIEMLTEMMSNPEVQKAFKHIPISAELAKDLGITDFRKASIFRALLDGIRKFFGLDPKYTHAMEAAMALSEQGFWRKNPTEALKYNARLRRVEDAERRTIDSQLRKSQSNVFKYTADPIGSAKRTERFPERVSSSISHFLEGRRGQASHISWEHGLRFLYTSTMRNWFEKYFPKGVFRTVQEGLEKAGVEMRRIIKQGIPLMKDTLMFEAKNPKEASKLYDLMSNTNMWGVHPDEPLGVGKNAHFRTKGVLGVHQADAVHWAEANKQYEALSSQAKEMYKRWRDNGETQLREELKASLANHVNMLYRNYRRDKGFQEALARKKAGEELTPKQQERIDRYRVLDKVIKDKELTPTEEEEYGNDPHVQAIRSIKDISNFKGPYFPMKRFGGYVVTARHEFDAGGGKRLSGDMSNHVMFNDRNAAFQYKKDLKSKKGENLKSRVEIGHYFDNPKVPGGREYVAEGERRQVKNAAGELVNIKPKYDFHVVVQDRHMELASNSREAEKLRKALIDAKLTDVSPIQLKRDTPYANYGLNGGGLAALRRGIDHMENLTDQEREQLHANLEHVAVATMQGNRLSKSYLQNRGVKGASDDQLRAFHARMVQSAIHRAYAKMMPAVDEAMDTMRDHAKANPSFERSALMRELEQRIYGDGRNGFIGRETPPILDRIMTLGFMKYLITPANTAMHLTHPTLVSVPYLAQKLEGENVPSIHRAMFRAYRMMGGVLPTVAEGWKKGTLDAWKFGWEPTSYVDNILKTVQKNGASKELMAALNSALELGTLHTTGFDFEPYFASTKLIDRMAIRGRDMAQEIMGSADAVNRIGVFITAHEKWLEKHPGDYEGAKNFANDSVSESLGLFSSTNRPRFLQNPYMRSIAQFKQIPMMIYNIMLRNVYNLVLNDEPGVKWQAIKGLTGVMGTSFALAGLSGAIPEPIRITNMVTHQLGLTDSWAEQEDKVRRYLAQNMSPEISGLVMDGLSGAFGADIHHRFGWNDLLLYAEPSSTNPQDVASYIDKTLIGVPGSLFADALDLEHALLWEGDYEKALEVAMPIKAIANLMKAGRLFTQGKPTSAGMPDVPPLSGWNTALQAMGWTPELMARHTIAKEVLWERQQEKAEDSKSIHKEYITGNRGDAILRMNRWNMQHPDEPPMTIKQLQEALKKSQQEQILGKSLTKQSRPLMQKIKRDYQLNY